MWYFWEIMLVVGGLPIPMGYTEVGNEVGYVTIDDTG